ncbi:MAG: D-alanyl-D-alanine carboxypeptidase family protein [Eubacteriales bacterium]|nr:D-alanyl-D-alanine carboxypeptidase family protein [Eubacteriales bacterium]
MKRMGLAVLLGICLTITAQAAELPDGSAKSAILMASDGTVLYESNADESLPPASVTKIMTMLLTMEALDEGRVQLTDMVTASANACSMGGTQIYLKEGEQMSLDDMLKSIAVGSANDAAVAVAEHLGGSEEGFVGMMNERAQQLGCTGTTFVNPNGLDTDGEETLTTARDLAIISRELMKHEVIYDYTTIWMDTVRDGTFQLANTNKLLRQYDGLTGLKTGYTSTAGFCISATARKDGMDLIAVVMAEPDKESRNADITAMLNYGFANYGMVSILSESDALPEIPVTLGKQENVAAVLADDTPVLMGKEQAGTAVREIELQESISAPVEAGTKIGEVVVSADGEEIARRDILTAENVEKKGISDIYRDLLGILLMK